MRTCNMTGARLCEHTVVSDQVVVVVPASVCVRAPRHAPSDQQEQVMGRSPLLAWLMGWPSDSRAELGALTRCQQTTRRWCPGSWSATVPACKRPHARGGQRTPAPWPPHTAAPPRAATGAHPHAQMSHQGWTLHEQSRARRQVRVGRVWRGGTGTLPDGSTP
jgi:hypothetical protein